MDKHRNRTYGRRKGKSLRANQKALLEQLLPVVSLDLSRVSGEVAGSFAQPPSDIWLEIGFGGGEHLLGVAARKPTIGFIGCEPFINGVAKILTGIQEQGLSNIRLHPGDAVDLMNALPDASIGRIYILYPDPWPKPRQRKRRFITEDNLQLMARVLAPGGQLRFASDIAEYCSWTLKKFSASEFFADDRPAGASREQPWVHWESTKYENKAQREGRSTSYFIFRRK
jgi:tRNA (guanine-N7-)-methyltransferase